MRLLDSSDLCEVDQGLEVDIWRPKVELDQPIGLPYGSHPVTWRVRASRAYRAVLAEHGWDPAGPLFVRIDPHGRIASLMHRCGRLIGHPTGRLTGEAIGDIVAHAATRAGLDVTGGLLPDLQPWWSGHSLRRSLATAARKAGKDMPETGRHGG